MDKSVDPHFQRIVMEYNDANQMVRETFFDHTGQSAKGFNGAYDIRFKYDSNGNLSERSFLIRMVSQSTTMKESILSGAPTMQEARRRKSTISGSISSR